MDRLRRRKWNWRRHMLRRNDDSIVKQAIQWTLQGHRHKGRPKITWKRDLEKKNVDSRFQVQLEKDGGRSTRQSWMETSCLYSLSTKVYKSSSYHSLGYGCHVRRDNVFLES